MKKLSFLLLAALASFMFVACDDNGTNASNSSEKESVASRVDSVYFTIKDTQYIEIPEESPFGILHDGSKHLPDTAE